MPKNNYEELINKSYLLSLDDKTMHVFNLENTEIFNLVNKTINSIDKFKNNEAWIDEYFFYFLNRLPFFKFIEAWENLDKKIVLLNIIFQAQAKIINQNCKEALYFKDRVSLLIRQPIFQEITAPPRQRIINSLFENDKSLSHYQKIDLEIERILNHISQNFNISDNKKEEIYILLKTSPKDNPISLLATSDEEDVNFLSKLISSIPFQ